MPQKQVHANGKNGGNKCNGLGSRLIVMARQAVSEWDEILAIYNFENLTTSILNMFRLFEWIYSAKTYVTSCQ